MTQETNIIYPPNSVSTASISRHAPLVTATDLRKIWLYGVKLEDRNKKPISDEVLTAYIMDAISYLETELNTTITPTQYTEAQDYRAEDYTSWCLFNLQHTPIIDCSAINARFTSSQVVMTFPKSWMRIYHEVGQIMLTPTNDELKLFAVSMNGVIWLPTGLMGYKAYPQFFEVVYTAGFEQDKIPAVLNNCIAMRAAILALAYLGNLIIAPGIAGYALGMDGLSQSVTKLPIPYQMIMQTLMQRFQESFLAVRKMYGRINFQVA